MTSLQSTHAFRYGWLLVFGLLAACQPQTELTPGSQPAPVVAMTNKDFEPIAPSISLPTTIEYHDNGGTLAGLVYRSTLTYDTQNRLLSISDQLVNSSTARSLWVQFHYTDNRLTSIDLPSVSVNPESPNYDEEKQPARFELTYAGQDVLARLLISGKEVQKSTLTLDERGLPVKNSLKRLFFDTAGNLDWITNSKQYPVNGTEIIEQRYDSNSAVFSQTREMQLLDGLLSIVNRRVYSSGISGLGSSLNTNNLVYTRRKNCDPKYGCREIGESHIDASAVNERGFPTQLLCSLGALGYYQFTVTYKQVKG